MLIGNNFMQSINSQSLLLTQSRKIQLSKIFYSEPLPSISRSKSLQFVPFLQERDSMNKLIKTSSRKQFSESPLAQSKLIIEDSSKEEVEKDERISKIVTSFFRKIDLEAKELSRGRRDHKKILVIAEKEMENNFYSAAQYDIVSALDQIKLRRKSILPFQNTSNSPTKLQKTISNSQVKMPSSEFNINNSRGIRPNSMFEKKYKDPNFKSISPLKKSLQSQSSHKKSQSLINTLKVKLNPEQPQYKRYKQQQQRSLKVFEDYEEGHQKFKQKMKQSKLIAYKIKRELQLD